jgi:hypothetical protein
MVNLESLRRIPPGLYFGLNRWVGWVKSGHQTHRSDETWSSCLWYTVITSGCTCVGVNVPTLTEVPCGYDSCRVMKRTLCVRKRIARQESFCERTEYVSYNREKYSDRTPSRRMHNMVRTLSCRVLMYRSVQYFSSHQKMYNMTRTPSRRVHNMTWTLLAGSWCIDQHRIFLRSHTDNAFLASNEMKRNNQYYRRTTERNSTPPATPSPRGEQGQQVPNGIVTGPSLPPRSQVTTPSIPPLGQTNLVNVMCPLVEDTWPGGANLSDWSRLSIMSVLSSSSIESHMYVVVFVSPSSCLSSSGLSR